MDSNSPNRKPYSGGAFWNSSDPMPLAAPESPTAPEPPENTIGSRQPSTAAPETSTPFQRAEDSKTDGIHPVITPQNKNTFSVKKAGIIIGAAAAVVVIAVAVILILTLPKQGSGQAAPTATMPATMPATNPPQTAAFGSSDSTTSPEPFAAAEEITTRYEPEPTAAPTQPPTDPPKPVDAQVEFETQKRDVQNATYFSSASASSVLGDQQGHNYSPSNVLRNDGTCWCEDASGYGEGEWIQLDLPDVQKVSGLRIINGYAGTAKQYDYNSKISNLTISFSDGSSTTISLNVFNTASRKTVQTVRFSRPVETEYVKLTINSVTAGDCEDTCLTFVEPF